MGSVRVASRNLVTGCLTKDVTRHFVDEALDGLSSPSAHSPLQRTELAQTVLTRVTSLELDEQFKCGLIWSLLKTARHCVPMILEDVRTPASRFIA